MPTRADSDPLPPRAKEERTIDGTYNDEAAAVKLAVLKAVNEMGKGEEEVSLGDETCTLSAYLEGTIHSINNNR